MKPADLRPTPDGKITGAWHPDTGRYDLEVLVDGKRLAAVMRSAGLTPDQLVARARCIRETLRSPDSVYLDAEGHDVLYFARGDKLPSAPRSRLVVFCVRVRRTGWRAFVWDFEPADEAAPSMPLARSPDRLGRRLL